MWMVDLIIFLFNIITFSLTCTIFNEIWIKIKILALLQLCLPPQNVHQLFLSQEHLCLQFTLYLSVAA